METIAVIVLAAYAAWQSVQIGTLKEKVRALEITEVANTKRIVQLMSKGSEPQYNEAIDPSPETPEEHDYLVRLHKEGEL